MSKFFAVSDVHSFYTPLIEALNTAGFDRDNEDHWLISCGDLFDRGDDSKEVLNFIQNLPRKTLIKGNHEYLFEEMCQRKSAYSHDVHNGTVKTVRDLCSNRLPADRPPIELYLLPAVSSFGSDCAEAKKLTKF